MLRQGLPWISNDEVETVWLPSLVEAYKTSLSEYMMFKSEALKLEGDTAQVIYRNVKKNTSRREDWPDVPLVCAVPLVFNELTYHLGLGGTSIIVVSKILLLCYVFVAAH